MVRVHFSVHTSFYCQGLTLVSRCSQLSRGWLPAAGTPLLQVSALSGPPGRRRPGSGRTPPRLEALAMEGRSASGVGYPRDVMCHLCDPTGTRADYGPTAQNNIKPLGFQKGRAPFVAFRPFWPLKMDPSASASPLARGASLDLRMRERKTKKVEAVFLDRFHLFQAIPFEIDLLWYGRTAARR